MSYSRVPKAGIKSIKREQKMTEYMQSVLDDIKSGKGVILIDGPDRELEGDIIFAPSQLTFDTLLFAIKCNGILCLSCSGPVLDRLEIPVMVDLEKSSCVLSTNFCVPVDLLSKGMTTGVSCAQRLRTIKAMVDPNMTAKDFAKPGHVQVLRARDGLLKERNGHTEGSVTLMKLAGLPEVAVIVEIMGQDGEMLWGKDLQDFADKHNMKIVSNKEVYEAFYGE